MVRVPAQLGLSLRVYLAAILGFARLRPCSAVFRSMPTAQLQLGADDPLLRPIRDALVAQEVGLDPFRHSGRRRCSTGVDVLCSRGVFAAQ